jgi:LEA14-like dessication related protein
MSGFLTKHKTKFIAGAIGLVTITGAIAYYQYNKLMDYAIKFTGVKIKKLGGSEISINIYLDFHNKASIAFDINSQKYDIYVNNLFVQSLINTTNTAIPAKSHTPMGLDVTFNPKVVLDKLGKSAASLMTDRENIKIKIVSKLRVKFWGFNVSIPYTYEDTLKNMMAS